RCCVFLDHYFGGTHSYSDVLGVTPVSVRGTNLDDLASTLRSFGYCVRGVKCSPSGLKSLKAPAVVALRKGSVDHFIVSLGYDAMEGSFACFDPPRKLGNLKYEAI